ncbi:MAG: flagellar filament capping protein FliD, partial [Candidatus Marinimicrobia bacterium]|nr:flagellar filament capping protein FliD [Candidatus Neomarinimicrobiota bacterium]
MAAIGSFGGGLDVTGLVAQFRSIELLKRTTLETRLSGLQSRKTALSELDSKLSALFTISDRFSETILFDPFAAREGASSDTSIITISADSTAQLGSHDIEVTRLASTDTRVSDLYTGSNTDFNGIVTDQSFDILVAHPIDGDESNRVAVTVTVTAASFQKSNEDLFGDISRAINDAIAAEVSSGNLEATERVTASFVAESAGDARLILRSGETGSDKALQFTDTDGLLGSLGLLRNATPNPNNGNGGYITAAADLDAEFILDGLTFLRGGNTVEDALTGVTLELLNVSVDPETVTIKAATQAVRDELNDFIRAYNAALEFVR